MLKCVANSMMDWHVPVYYGQMTKSKIDSVRLSSTFSVESFAREYGSIWIGNSRESWFNADMLLRRRCLLKCERTPNFSKPNTYYILGVDVGRYQANTAITVAKVVPNATRDTHRAKIVYLEIIHGASFITEQAPRIKKLIQIYRPREIVIDGNGLGAGLMDAMCVETFDPKTGERFPPYYAFNFEGHLPPGKKSTADEPNPDTNAIIYDLKANASNDSPIHSNAYSRINGGNVMFLAAESVIKSKLMATRKGQKMTQFDKRVFLLPYEMTSRLIDEMNNLKLKPTGAANQIKVEQISKQINKDRWSSLEYALWRVKYYEDKDARHSKKSRDFKSFTFFTPNSRR